MDLRELKAYLDTFPEKGIPGCDIRVRVAHEEVLRYGVGTGRPGQPLRGDEMYWLYSATKPVTMTAIMQMVEKGLLGLDDPVSKYLPEYANLTVRDGDTVRPARTELTLRMLMTMQGGLDYDGQRPALVAAQKRFGKSLSTREAVRALAKDPFLFDPGTHFNYSLCHDVALAVAEVACGMRYSEYVQKNIFEPLGMRSMTFHPTEADKARLAARYCWDENEYPHPQGNTDNQFVFSDEYESGGAGLVADADSYILLTDALANGGVGANGNQILTRESIDEMRRNQLGAVQLDDFHKIPHAFGYGYGLGVRTLIDPTKSEGPLGEFGWDGAAGAYTFAEPESRVAVFFAMHVLNCGHVYMEYHRGIRDLIFRALKKD